MFLQELPSRINSDEERELLALMLRVHELEADKMMLQSERLVKQHELRRRELLLLRYDRQRQISDEIITRQRRIMEGRYISETFQRPRSKTLFLDILRRFLNIFSTVSLQLLMILSRRLVCPFICIFVYRFSARSSR